MAGNNEVTVAVRPNVFSVIPSIAEVVGGLEPLRLRVDWSGNEKTFNLVTIGGFRDSQGRLLYAIPSSLTFDLTEHMIFKDVRVGSVTQDVYCKYDVEYRYVDGSTMLFDPVVIIKPR